MPKTDEDQNDSYVDCADTNRALKTLLLDHGSVVKLERI